MKQAIWSSYAFGLRDKNIHKFVNLRKVIKNLAKETFFPAIIRLWTGDKPRCFT